jgi:hypothetical protein
MTALILEDGKEPLAFIQEYIGRFNQEVIDRLHRLC